MNLYSIYSILILSFLASCSTSDDVQEMEYSEKWGIGSYSNLELDKSLDTSLVAIGDKLYMSKCATCHFLSDETLNGPGWEDLTHRRDAAWIMNLMTNTEEMLEKDLALKKQKEQYKMTMPDFGLSDQEARALLEFMRSNDRGMVDRDREMPSTCKHISRRK